MNRKINTYAGITILLIAATILVLTSLFIIGNDLYKKGNIANQSIDDSGLKENPVVEDDSNIDEANINNDVEENVDPSYIRTTSFEIRVGTRDDFANVVISNGTLVVTLDGDTGNYTLNGEKAKYIYCDYYQYSDSNVVFVLTESGNIYMNEFEAIGSDITVFNNFSKLDYSNVSELKKVDNPNYGVVDEFGFTDNKEYYLYALINGELNKLEYQYEI